MDSRAFSDASYRNPMTMPISSRGLTSSRVQIGAYTLSSDLIGQISDWVTFEPKISEKNLQQQGLARDGAFLYRRDPHKPQVGDVRLHFRMAGKEKSQFSAIGRQQQEGVGKFQTKAGDVLEMLSPGLRTKEEMFADARQSNTVATWGLRLAGWVLMFLGMTLMASPITTLVSWVPVVSGMVNLLSYLMMAILATTCSLIVIAIGWFR